MLNEPFGSEAHLTAPARAAQFSFWIMMSREPYVEAPVASCHGFKDCVATAVSMLGPLSLQVAP